MRGHARDAERAEGIDERSHVAVLDVSSSRWHASTSGGLSLRPPGGLGAGAPRRPPRASLRAVTRRVRRSEASYQAAPREQALWRAVGPLAAHRPHRSPSLVTLGHRERAYPQAPHMTICARTPL